MENKIVIFDLDGVLIKPAGYRKATRDTVVHFLEVYQINANPPCESDLSLFESVGITCEWDMIPLSLLAAMNESARQNGGQNSTAPHEISPNQMIQVDYQAYIRAFGSLMQPGVPPSEAVSRYCIAADGQNLFPHLQNDRIEKLLDNTRDFITCPTTQYLENFVLGSQIFEQIFGRPAMVACPSYLETEDTVQLTQEVSHALMSARRSQDLSIAMMTARYSAGPADLADRTGLRIPEAEIAARMLGWEDVPLIGFGHLLALGERSGRSAEDLLKPQPVHALAAILAASGLPEWIALQEA
ncbi:MAG: hypothetical protein HGA86_04670, partial [Anaerolineaceae bacterium]|nr:hypothetical protein [Anaerolineaceae bacterium]